MPLLAHGTLPVPTTLRRSGNANDRAPLRFTVDQYHRMIRLGILTEADSVELLEGRILRKGGWRDGEPVAYRFTPDQCLRLSAAGIVSEDEAFTLAEGGGCPEMPRSPAHDSAIDRLDDAIRPLLPPDWRLRIQSAVRLPGGEPEKSTPTPRRVPTRASRPARCIVPATSPRSSSPTCRSAPSPSPTFCRERGPHAFASFPHLCLAGRSGRSPFPSRGTERHSSGPFSALRNSHRLSDEPVPIPPAGTILAQHV